MSEHATSGIEFDIEEDTAPRGWVIQALEEIAVNDSAAPQPTAEAEVHARNSIPQDPSDTADGKPDFYEKIIAPARDAETEYATPISIVDNHRMLINGSIVAMGGHQLFLFNALMHSRGQGRITRKSLMNLGFYPNAASDSTRSSAFSHNIEVVMTVINDAVGEPVIERRGSRGGAYYTMSPSLGFSSFEATGKAIERRPDTALAVGATALEVAPYDEEEKETAKRDRIAEQLIERYGEHVAVGLALSRQEDRKRRQIEVDPEDVLAVCRQEAGKYKLLTAQQEILLARRMRRGFDAYEAMALESRTDPTPEEEKLFIDLVAAHQVMCVTNMRLVLSIARKYMYAASTGFGKKDIITEGNIGLINAVRRFDERKGFKFSTFATWWIRQGMQRAISNQGRTVRLPVHVDERLKKANKFIREQEKQGRTASAEEIAANIKRPEEEVVDMLRFGRFDMPSLDSPITEDSKTTRGEIIADTHQDSDVEYQMSILSDQEELEKLLRNARLNSRELVILWLRYGVESPSILSAIEELKSEGINLSISDIISQFDAKGELSWSAIGAAIGVSREQARKLEGRALNQIAEKAGVRYTLARSEDV